MSTPPKFKIGDLVRKTKGSQWSGTVVGTYSTELTPEGYAVESSTEKGSVQIYPAAALSEVNPWSLENAALISNLVQKHQLAVEDLTERQLAEAIRQAIASGDFVRNILSDGPQAVTYIPYRDIEHLKSRYHELLYAVACKFEGETRHETALRYINEREKARAEVAQLKACAVTVDEIASNQISTIAVVRDAAQAEAALLREALEHAHTAINYAVTKGFEDTIKTIVNTALATNAGHEFLADVERLRDAAEAHLEAYLNMVNSGDCGNWNPEEDPHVVALRAALSKWNKSNK